MRFTNPITLPPLLLVAAAISTVVVADDAPDRPRFACTVNTPKCNVASEITSSRYPGGLQLSACYEHNSPMRFFRKLFKDDYIYTFKAHCPAENSEECEKYLQQKENDKHELDWDHIDDDLAIEARAQNNCWPKFDCYGLDEMKDDCFKK